MRFAVNRGFVIAPAWNHLGASKPDEARLGVAKTYDYNQSAVISIRKTNYILLTFDIEDWFQVENFKQWIPYSSWSRFNLRVERNTHRILDLLDTAPARPSFADACSDAETDRRTRATFFVLGWVAERLPDLVRQIRARGHEVASHGYRHVMCTEQNESDLTRDLEESKKLIEDITGAPVYGYRAPSFSINPLVLRTVEKCGYTYDSSLNSFAAHSRYGQLELSGFEKMGIASRVSSALCELPISNLKLGKRVVPWGGGGYFRLIPHLLFKRGVASILRRDHAYLFYLHPWEIDTEQPRVKGPAGIYRVRHYMNINRSLERLRRLIKAFETCHFVPCNEYLKLFVNT